MDTKRRYLAFDIETSRIAENDWRSCRPLGVTCAATLMADSPEPILWHGGDRKSPADRMSRPEAATLVHYLSAQVAKGYTLLTWNGVGFDFDILAEESGSLEACRNLAIGHVDMMFHVLCKLGYGVGLDAAAKGMSIAGKPEGMNGAVAPVLWAEKRREEVLRYVAQDVRITMDVATACEALGALRWVARSGKVRTMSLPKGWLAVGEARSLPVPNTSWMDEPWPRERFMGWMR